MPVYMDRHYVEGATRHAVADAHQKDLALQDKYHVKFLTYWFDEMRSTAFCLIETFIDVYPTGLTYFFSSVV